MIKVLGRRQLWYGLLLLTADAAFFGLTNPARLLSVGFVIGFLLLMLSLYYLFGGFLTAVKLYGLSFGRHKRRLTLWATGVTAGLLALQSIGELSLRDVIVAAPLAVVLYLYINYGRARSAASS